MRKITLATVALIAVLAACSPPADKKGDAPAPTVAAPKAGAMMTPGQWRTTMTITAMSIPGVPPEAAAGMKTRPFSSEECVTSQDMTAYLDKRAVSNPDDAQNCSSRTMNYSNGRIVGESVCADGSGHPHTVKMTGTYNAERVDMVVSVEGEGARGPESQTMSLSAERIGACPG